MENYAEVIQKIIATLEGIKDSFRGPPHLGNRRDPNQTHLHR